MTGKDVINVMLVALLIVAVVLIVIDTVLMRRK